MRRVLLITSGVVLGAALVAHPVLAQNPPMPMREGPPPSMHSGQMPMPPGGMPHGQQMSHMPGMAAGGTGMPGQDAFGAIAEVVRLLDADPSTDWSKVDLERLRQHLIDMNEVVLRAQVKQASVLGGLAMEVTGAGRTERAIRAMIVPHATELDRMPSYASKTELIPGGVRLTVTAKAVDDVKTVARLRALGFIGLLTEGEHHGPHHLAMAKGEALPDHSHRGRR
jgi:hypothetical protein